MVNDKIFNMKLSSEESERLTLISEKTRMSKSKIIRELINKIRVDEKSKDYYLCYGSNTTNLNEIINQYNKIDKNN